MFQKRIVLTVVVSGLLIAAAAACSAAATPSQSSTAMTAQETDAAMMMAKETDTAIMAKATEGAMMMSSETDTAMMAKETESAMMMAKETDTAIMATETESAMMMAEFPPQQFAAHFVDSMPIHEGTLDALPEQVHLNFNFTLSDASTITIEKDGKELSTVPGKLGADKLSMTAEIPADAGAGLYLVKYKACWPDNSCHNGQFAFAVK